MNLVPIALLGATTYLLMRQTSGARQLVQGQSYVAVLDLPDTGITVDQLALVLPDGSGIQLDGRRAVVTFTAPRTAEMTDISTPLGTVRVVSVRRVSDVVGALDPSVFKPALYTFSGFYRREDGMGLRWSGWTKPMVHTFSSAQQYMLDSPWVAAQAYRWHGGQWKRA